MQVEDIEALIELCDRALRHLRQYDEGVPYEKLQIGRTFQTLVTPLMSGRELIPDFRKEIPMVELHRVTSSVRHLAGGSSFTLRESSQQYGPAILVVREALQGVLAKLKRPGRGSAGPRSVFYSWQSTLPNSSNRSLIRTSLEKAVASINAGVEVQDSLRVDSDTGDRPGSPKIFDTILEKIELCDAFIADVSLVAPKQSNSNVMVELGYALKVLGRERIVMVFNTAFGEIGDLPFDLGFSRVIPYACAADESDKAAVRASLSPKLKSAIEAIVKSQTA